MNYTLTIFIPAYNEEQNLSHSIEVLLQKTTQLGVIAEILVVDDGSCDQTGCIADQLADAQPAVHVVHHQRNQGIGAAFTTAIRHARSEWLIFIPADLALEPDELSLYLSAAPQADIVVGNRSDRSDYTLARKLVSWINIRMIQVLFGMQEHQYQYISLYRLDVLREIEIEYWRSAFFLAEILVKAKALGKRLVEVEIKYIPRSAGKATGARFKQVVLTVHDMFHFWLKWIWFGPEKASKRHLA